jgi:hypothetical protein
MLGAHFGKKCVTVLADKLAHVVGDAFTREQA